MTPSRTTARLRTALLYVVFPALVAITASRTVAEVRSSSHFGAVIDQGEIKLHDFAWIFTFAKTFWRGEGGFSVEDHLRVTEHLAGRRLPDSLPFGYSPTMLWVLGPLCPLPAAWAYIAWTLLGLVGVLWICRRQQSAAVALAFVSPVAVGCWGLGQTAVLSTVALLYLMHWDVTSGSARVGRRELMSIAAVVWMLTAKPPLAIAAATALLAGRRLRIVVAALALTVVSSALILPMFGKAGIVQYLGILTHYDLDTAPGWYAWSLRPESMANLRALLHVTFGVGDAAASRWSLVLWLLASASIVVAAARREIPTELRWSLAVLAYLLFCPHVSWTEELHLVVIVAALGAATGVPASIRGAGSALALGIVFLFPMFAFGSARAAAAFTGTALLGALLIAIASRGPASRATQTPLP